MPLEDSQALLRNKLLVEALAIALLRDPEAKAAALAYLNDRQSGLKGDAAKAAAQDAVEFVERIDDGNR